MSHLLLLMQFSIIKARCILQNYVINEEQESDVSMLREVHVDLATATNVVKGARR